jgi:hypothetical protein
MRNVASDDVPTNRCDDQFHIRLLTANYCRKIEAIEITGMLMSSRRSPCR